MATQPTQKKGSDVVKPSKLPLGSGTGYPQTGIKTSGIKQRGSGAATKGFTSRGPMA